MVNWYSKTSIYRSRIYGSTAFIGNYFLEYLSNLNYVDYHSVLFNSHLPGAGFTELTGCASKGKGKGE